jgi:hypothetical protein
VPADPAAAQGRDVSLCASVDSRVNIPANFVADACWDGQVLHIRNRTAFVLDITATGTSGAATRSSAGERSVESSFIAAVTGPQSIPPGFQIDLPFGDNPGVVEVRGDATNRSYALVRAILSFIPGGAGVLVGEWDYLAALTADLQNAVSKAIRCSAGADAVTRAVCSLGFTWDTTVAFTRFAVRTGFQIGKAAIALLWSLIEDAKWSVDMVNGAIDFHHGTQQLTIHGAPAAAPVTTIGPSLPARTAAPPRTAPKTSAAAPPRTAPQTSAAPPAPPSVSRSVLQYACANDNSNQGHYVPAGHYWQQQFTAHAGTITGGWVLLGANLDGGNHNAVIGVYADAGRTQPLATVISPVSGYGGVSFSFSTPARVTEGESVWLTTTGVGDFTAYDNATTDCFIAHLIGNS